MTPRLEIVSGGQTGVDRGALEAALALGLEHGGWCPRGRKAEDGAIPPRYRLREAESEDYAVRTQLNVRDSDATLILAPSLPLRGGTALTQRCAQALGKPCLVLVLDDAETGGPELRAWLREHQVEVLNVAGPRESGCPGLEARSQAALEEWLG